MPVSGRKPLAGSSVVIRHCSAAPRSMIVVLGQAEVGEGLAGGDPQLGDCTRSTSVTSSVTVCSTWMRGFISMKTCRPSRVEQELHRAGVDVADVPGERDRVGADPLPQLRVEVGRRRDLDDLLVAALHRAVPLVQVDHVARGVGQDLHLDVPRADHRLLEEHGRRRRTPTRPRASPASIASRSSPRLAHPAHPRPPPPATALTNTGKPISSAAATSASTSVRGSESPAPADPGLPGRGDRAGLVAGQLQHRRRRADEGDPGPRARRGQVGVLGQEPVAGVDRVGAGLAARAR